MKALLIALLLLVPATAAADAAYVSKKDASWIEKQAKREPIRKVNRKKLVGKKPPRVVSIFNTWTHEWLAVDASSKKLPTDIDDRFFRCHFTNEPTAMDDRLGAKILEAARHFGARRINIVSGYRAPKYNLMLRKKGRRVSKDSEHTRGHAIDFWLPGISVEQLYEWAMSNQIGGVGKYISDGFVHVDVGRKRTWIDP